MTKQKGLGAKRRWTNQKMCFSSCLEELRKASRTQTGESASRLRFKLGTSRRNVTKITVLNYLINICTSKVS